MDRKVGERVNLPQRMAAVLLAGVALASCVAQGNHASSAEPVASPEAITSNANLVTGSVDLLGPQQHWQLAGVTPKPSLHQLAVRSMNLAIVKQDGTPGQIDPPVNLYGTRLGKDGDFSVTTTLSGITGASQVSLYGKPPLIEDEWRAEMGSLDMKINGNAFTATESDQVYGKNARQVKATITAASKHVIKMTDRAGKLSFSVDNHAIGTTIADDGIFKTNTVYVGLDALSPSGSFTVNQLTAKGEGVGKVGLVDTRLESIVRDPNGFAALANTKRPNFLIGAAVAPGPMLGDPTYRKLLGNYSEFSAEDAAKWQHIHPLPGNSLSSYNFADMDSMVSMASKAGIKVHGHAMLFSEANPAWLQTMAKLHPEQLQQTMIDDLTTIATHYKGKVASWDVINEPLADYDTPAGQYGLRKNFWYNTLGPQYLVTALKTVKAADPTTEVGLNDFGMESDDTRFAQMIDLIKFLQSQGAPVDFVGFQSHIDNGDTNSADTNIDIANLRSRFQDLAALGVKARVSELDVSGPSEYPVFGDVVTACLDEPNCEGVTMWGITNKYSSGGSLNAKGIVVPGIGLPWSASELPLAPVTYIKNALK